MIWFPFICRAVRRAKEATASSVRRLRHPRVLYVHSVSSKYTCRELEASSRSLDVRQPGSNGSILVEQNGKVGEVNV